jgi:Zn-dependent protease with chaperone function
MMDLDPTGRFHAGEGRPAVPVILVETPDHLEIRDPMNLLVAAWAWGDIIRHRREGADTPFRYTCRPFPGQKVETHDPGSLRERLERESTLARPLAGDRPKPAPTPPPRARFRWALGRRFLGPALTTLALGVLLGIAAMALPGLANRLAIIVPASAERDWGAALAPRFGDHGLLFCENAPGLRTIERLVDRLSGPMAAPWPVRVQVIRAPRTQVVTLPGGQIILFEGLVDAARSPDEVAGLLAHALAHSVLHHDTEALVRRRGLPALLALMNGDLDRPDLSLQAVLDRKDSGLTRELAADRLAADALLAAGLRAHGLALAVQEGKAGPGDTEKLGRGTVFLSPQATLHPPYAERLSALRRVPRGGEEAMDAEDWDTFKRVCR